MFGQPRPIEINPDYIVATVIAFVIGITIHEFMPAWSAYQLGDPTAARLGRITLNPVSHFDPLGFIFMIMLSLGFGVIAWGKPVPVNPAALRGGRHGMAITAVAGPASNLVIAAAVAIPMRFGGIELDGFMELLVRQVIWLNLLLAAFNMIPIPPLDGSKILAGILPNFWYQYLAPLQQYGIAILLVLVVVGGGVLQAMYLPVFTLFWDSIVGSTQL
ncbi:site-2 protease family protein [soil metagenome]